MAFSDFPFLRYLFFFALGILLSNAMPEAQPKIFLGLLSILWILYAILLLRPSFSTSYSTSFLAYLLMMCFGVFVTLRSNSYAIKEEIPWGAGAGYLAEVQHYDIPKANSSENLLAVVAVKEGESWRSQRALVLIYHQLDTSLVPGQLIWVPENPEELAPAIFPNEFAYKEYLASKGIHFRQFLGKKLRLIPGPQTFQFKFVLADLRHYFAKAIERYVARPESIQLALALLLGQKESLGKDVKQAFAVAGTQHILAVSGLHVGIIYSILLLPLTYFKKVGTTFRRSYLLLVLCLLWIYALMSGFSPSVVRAVVMFSLVTLGQIRKRKPSIWNTLSFSALLLLVLDPGVGKNLGFQLSYLAVAGIVSLQPLILQFWSPSSRILDYFWQMTSVTLAAQLITSPLTIYYFHTFPTYFLLANLLIVPLSYLILCVGVPFLMLAWIPFLGGMLGAVVDFLLLFQIEITYRIYYLPTALLQGIHLSFAGMLAIWVFLWIWSNWELGNRKWHLKLGMLVVFLWATSNFWEETQRPTQELYLFSKEGQWILDLKLGAHHLSWNQNFPVDQISFSIQPNRLANRRNSIPIPLKAIVEKDSIWFPGIDLVVVPSQNQLVWGALAPKLQEPLGEASTSNSHKKDRALRPFAGYRVVF